MLLTDVHQYKKNLDEHFSKLINNKSRIAVSVTSQGSPCPQVLCVPQCPWSNLCFWVSPAHSSPPLLFPFPWDSRQGLSSTLFPKVCVLHETQG